MNIWEKSISLNELNDGTNDELPKALNYGNLPFETPFFVFYIMLLYLMLLYLQTLLFTIWKRLFIFKFIFIY